MKNEINKDYVKFHLQETVEAVQDTIDDIENREDYEIGSYIVDMMHIFHHINSAWNARFATVGQVEACTEEDFERWRQYPSDLPMT